MGVTIFRPGQGLYIPGVTVMQPRPSAVAGGWWDVAGQTCVAAYQPKGSASLAASYVNLANPGTYDAAPGVAPTLDADGWAFNGSTQYLTTGVTPASAAWSYIVRFSDVTGAGGVIFGCGNFSTGTNIGIIPNAASNTLVRYINSVGLGSTSSPQLANGVLAIAASTGYRNGAPDVTSLPTWATGAQSLYIGASNNSGAALITFIGTIQALAIYSTTLSAGDVASLTTAMNLL